MRQLVASQGTADESRRADSYREQVEWECTAGGRGDMRDGRLGGQGGMAGKGGGR